MAYASHVRSRGLTAASTTARVSVRCIHCSLPQFANALQICRRCHQPYVELPPLLPSPDPELEPPLTTLSIYSRTHGERDLSQLTASGYARTVPLVIRMLRLRLNASQVETCRRLPCLRNLWNKWERGNSLPSVRSLCGIAQTLKVTPQVFLELCELVEKYAPRDGGSPNV